MSETNEYLTKEKFDELSKELLELKTTRRKEVAENLEYAKALGDLSENAEYHEAREMQANVEDRIAKLENILQSAVIMSDGKRSGVVSVGATVTVKNEKDGKESTYTLVGSEETNVSLGKVSIHSPFGEALVGKKQGDSVTFKTPGGMATYVVVSIK